MATETKQPFRKLRLRFRVEEITQEETIGERFKKREVRGVVDGEYPQHYSVQFSGKKLNAMDEEGIMEGTYCTMICFVNGRKIEKEGKSMYFTSIDFHEFESES